VALFFFSPGARVPWNCFGAAILIGSGPGNQLGTAAEIVKFMGDGRPAFSSQA